MNVEHDMECSDELVQQLLDCPEPMCTHAYRLYQDTVHYAHRQGKKPPCGGPWISEDDESATYGGIGFCKLTSEVRLRPLSIVSWDAVDCEIANATDALWHVHWPEVEHRHR